MFLSSAAGRLKKSSLLSSLKKTSQSIHKSSPVQHSSVTEKLSSTPNGDGFSPLSVSNGRYFNSPVGNPQPLKNSSGMSTIWRKNKHSKFNTQKTTLPDVKEKILTLRAKNALPIEHSPDARVGEDIQEERTSLEKIKHKFRRSDRTNVTPSLKQFYQRLHVPRQPASPERIQALVEKHQLVEPAPEPIMKGPIYAIAEYQKRRFQEALQLKRRESDDSLALTVGSRKVKTNPANNWDNKPLPSTPKSQASELEDETVDALPELLTKAPQMKSFQGHNSLFTSSQEQSNRISMNENADVLPLEAPSSSKTSPSNTAPNSTNSSYTDLRFLSKDTPATTFSSTQSEVVGAPTSPFSQSQLDLAFSEPAPTIMSEDEIKAHIDSRRGLKKATGSIQKLRKPAQELSSVTPPSIQIKTEKSYDEIVEECSKDNPQLSSLIAKIAALTTKEDPVIQQIKQGLPKKFAEISTTNI